jgi:Na+/H+-dicarboxylate symporter
MTASFVVNFFTEISEVLLKIINWIIACTPFAVLSLIANAIGSQDDLSGAFSNVGYLIAANLVGFIAHFLITDVGLFYLLTGTNPIEYLRFIVPAQTTALACASSAATLPVTLRCVKNTGRVPDDIRNFVCPLGATINMDGSAIYFPCACIWLAILNGIKPDAGSYILLIILSTIGSAGAAPVPSSGLVLVITAYNTVFGTTGTPNGFEFVVAIDWFLDRCITALNVTGDTVVCGIIAARTPWEEEDTTNLTKTTDITKTVDKVELGEPSSGSEELSKQGVP